MMKFYKFTSIPLLIGLALSILFSYLFAGSQYYPLSPNSAMGQFYYHHLSEPVVMIVAILLWISIGILFYFTNLIFTQTDWSITRATLLHFLCSYIGLLAIGILAGWFSPNLANVLSFTVEFIIIYLFIWLFNYYRNKKYVAEINQQLANKRR